MRRATGFELGEWTKWSWLGKFLMIGLLAILWESPAAAQGACNPTAPGNVRVRVVNSAFNPSDVTIDCGQKVCWEWIASGHTTTSDTPGWDSESQLAGATFGVTFPAPANAIGYYCKFHGGPGGFLMSGVIRVRNNCGSPSTPTRTRTPRPTETPTLTPIPGPVPSHRSSPLLLLTVMIAVIGAAGLLRRIRTADRGAPAGPRAPSE